MSRFLSQLTLVLVLGALAVPLAHATGPYDGYKSSYPQLHLVLSHQVTAPLAQPGAHSFGWHDAAVGAGTAAGAIFLLAGAALFLTRRRMKPAV